MADLNRVFLIGRLTHDAELKYTTSNQPVCQFSLAVNTPKREGDEWTDATMFINRISLWGKRAEAITEHLLKGKLIFVEGRLRMDEWEREGEKRRELRIVASEIKILSSPRAETGAGGLKGEAFPKPESELADDEDLPF